MGLALRSAALLALTCAACSLPLPQHTNASNPAFTEAPCAFRVPAGAQVRCGWLTVPESRKLRRSRTIRLHVAIYKSRKTPSAPDPILWLVGGPGGRGNVLASALYNRVVEPYHATRDFIVLDIRGTGYSQPALNCPDSSSPPEQWLTGCRKLLSAQADLAAYNSAAVAADIADLRRALGIREWNLLGESYGTRLALTAMRDHPEGIRSVILDSVSPPEIDQYASGPANFEAALQALAADFAGAFPNLIDDLRRAADSLDASPRRLTGTWRDTPIDARFDGARLMETVHMALYESDLIPQLPNAIRGLADAVWIETIGRHSAIPRLLMDVGAHLSFHCVEEVPFTDVARLRAEDEKRAWLRHAATGLSIVNSCRIWLPRYRPEARESQPVTSDIPTLVLAGEYDPVTPPAYARSAAGHLRNSHLFVFPQMGHWLTANTVDSCPQNLVLAFLSNPSTRPNCR